MKRIVNYLCALVCLMLTMDLYAQQTVTISGSDLTDAMLFRNASNPVAAMLIITPILAHS